MKHSLIRLAYWIVEHYMPCLEFPLGTLPITLARVNPLQVVLCYVTATPTRNPDM